MKLCPKCQKHFSDDANFCPVDAARLVPLEGQGAEQDSLSARFTLAGKLGGGRTGTVYRATDKQTGATVAVKVVAPSVIALPGVAQRLERELKQLERVQSAGVARVLASGKRGEETWVAMELIEGAQTLADAIGTRGPIPLEYAAHLVEVVGEALIDAAQVGVVHRDLAPKNILFAGSDIKVINFSLPVPTTSQVPGVPEFVAPEQVEGKPVDQRSNLYSLGALYYYVLTGQPVHAGAAEEVHRQHIHGTIRTPSSIAPVPAAVESVIMRALDRSPTKRFLTVRQFVDEVTRVARNDGDPKSTQPMGKVGRPKAELVQTLIGMRNVAPVTPAAPAAQPAAQGPVGTGTVLGMPGPTHLQAPAMQAPVAVAAPSPIAPSPEPAAAPAAAPAASGDPRSPWASPGAGTAPTPAAAAAPAPAPAAPDIQRLQQAPQMSSANIPAGVMPSAPVVAAPQVAGQAGGKKKAPAEDNKGKFRETMWFKKGDMDAAAAVAAAEEHAATGKAVDTDKADSLPIDERYKDDGSISRGDKEKYSLRTGATQMMMVVKDPNAGGNVSEDALVAEMKGGRGKILALVIAVLVGIAALVYFMVL